MVTLKDPFAISKSEYLKNHFLTELGLVYNINSYEQAAVFKLVEDPEFMLKF
jgi:glucose-6-phosphate isomerase